MIGYFLLQYSISQTSLPCNNFVVVGLMSRDPKILLRDPIWGRDP